MGEGSRPLARGCGHIAPRTGGIARNSGAACEIVTASQVEELFVKKSSRSSGPERMLVVMMTGSVWINERPQLLGAQATL